MGGPVGPAPALCPAADTHSPADQRFPAHSWEFSRQWYGSATGCLSFPPGRGRRSQTGARTEQRAPLSASCTVTIPRHVVPAGCTVWTTMFPRDGAQRGILLGFRTRRLCRLVCIRLVEPRLLGQPRPVSLAENNCGEGREEAQSEVAWPRKVPVSPGPEILVTQDSTQLALLRGRFLTQLQPRPLLSQRERMTQPPFSVEEKSLDEMGADPGLTFSRASAARPVVKMWKHTCARWPIPASPEWLRVCPPHGFAPRTPCWSMPGRPKVTEPCSQQCVCWCLISHWLLNTSNVTPGNILPPSPFDGTTLPRG